MATTLVNTTRRRLIIQLVHPAFYKKRFGWGRTIVRTKVLNPKTGERGLREHRKSIPGSLTVPASSPQVRGELVGLPDEIAAVPDVAKYVKAGKLKLVTTAEAKPAPPAPKPVEAKPSSDGKSDKEKKRGGDAR